MADENNYHEEIQRMKFWGSNQDPDDQIELKEELEKNVIPNCFKCHHPQIFHSNNEGACFFKWATGYDTKPVQCTCPTFDQSNLSFFKQVVENEKHNEETLRKWREEHPGL
jgi:hypothetical protein